MASPQVPDAFSAVEQLSRLMLDAFEREFWAGRHSRPALAAAPLRALVQQLPPPPDRPSPPLVPCPDLEHQRLYDEAARLWYATDSLHRCLHGVVQHLDTEPPEIR
jgi:hypothetical protein